MYFARSCCWSFRCLQCPRLLFRSTRLYHFIYSHNFIFLHRFIAFTGEIKFSLAIENYKKSLRRRWRLLHTHHDCGGKLCGDQSNDGGKASGRQGNWLALRSLLVGGSPGAIIAFLPSESDSYIVQVQGTKYVSNIWPRMSVSCSSAAPPAAIFYWGNRIRKEGLSARDTREMVGGEDVALWIYSSHSFAILLISSTQGERDLVL